MATENFYQGARYSIDPNFGQPFSGYSNYQSGIGVATDFRTANQLAEISKKLNIGARTIEFSMVQPEVFESIPKQQFEEVRRISKLTGADVSLHAPIVGVEPAGFDKEGKWSEAQRIMTERQMLDALQKAQILAKDKGIPVTFHSSAGMPEGFVKIKEGEGKEPLKAMYIIDPQSGNISAIRERAEYLEKPEAEAKKFNPEEELKRQNHDIWLKSLNDAAFNAERGAEVIDGGLRWMEKEALGIRDEKERRLLQEKGIIPKEGKNMYDVYSTVKQESKAFNEMLKSDDEAIKHVAERIKEGVRHIDHGEIFLGESYNHLRELFNRVYQEDLPEDQKKKLQEFAKEVQATMPKIKKDPSRIPEFREIIEKGIATLRDVDPQIYKPLDQFMMDKSAQTFGEVAWKTYKDAKDKNKVPIISIENPPVGAFGGRAEQLKELIEKSREQLVKQAVSEGRMSKAEAEKLSQTMIGATWDVGHINMLKKYGYSDEDLRKQTEKIAPMVKHVHLSDNFGMEHTELPMGMGNVPVDKMLKELEKAGVSPKKIIEAGNWYQHFKTVPFKETLGALGSPVYAMKAEPYWAKSAGMYQQYGAGYGNIFPEEHFSMYGGGFSALPMELGGNVPGKQSRFSGTPME